MALNIGIRLLIVEIILTYNFLFYYFCDRARGPEIGTPVRARAI